jgi:hypothetical protein
MRRTVFALLILSAAACDGFRGPRLALPTSPGTTMPGDTNRGGSGAPVVKPATVYGGKTAEQWGKELEKSNHDDVAEACRALHVLAAEGRPYLFQGLDCANCETRRLCLEHLNVGDFKRLGEAGRLKLVKLSGDRDDLRIRGRATDYLRQWNGAIPTP